MAIQKFTDGAPVTMQWFNSVAQTVNELTSVQVIFGSTVVKIVDEYGLAGIKFNQGAGAIAIDYRKKSFTSPPTILAFNGDSRADHYGIVVSVVHKDPQPTNGFSVQCYDSAGKIGNKQGYVKKGTPVRINWVAFAPRK